METQKHQKLSNEDRIRYGIIAFVVLLVITLLAWILITIFKPATLTISPTNISLDDGVAVSGDKVIAYNGSSFIEISPGENIVKTIYTPTERFPSVDSIVYAPGVGMLLTFSGNTMETPVFDYKLSLDDDYGVSLLSDNNFTWYLDFKTDKLSFVWNQEMDRNLAYYNQGDKSFYIVGGDEYEGYTDFLKYNPSNNKFTRLSTDLDYTDAKDIHQCGDATCIIGHKNQSRDEATLSKISSDGKSTEVKKVTGDILPTPDSNTFAYLTEPDNAPTEEDTDEHDEFGAGIVSYQKINLTNISTGESKEYSGLYKPGGSIGMYDDTFYYMSGTDGTYQYLKRSSHDIDFDYNTDASDFAEGFININMVGDKFALIADVDRKVYIVSTNKSMSVFDKADADTINKNIDACASKVNSDAISVRSGDDTSSVFDVDFEIMVTDDNDFNTNIHNMNKCIAEKTENLVGYSYIFTGVSPINGKITTE